MSNRTFILRETGDNFRAASRYPTEQTSFNIPNIKKLWDSPYGQFVTTLWRSAESRAMVKLHLSAHYAELSVSIKYGVDLVINDEIERFNVIAVLVADLCFLRGD